MNSTEIVEGNKLIAHFSDPTWKDRVDLSWKDIEDYLPSYHLYWDYLMPTIEQIESLKHPVYISSNNCIIYEKVGRDHGWHFDNYGKTKIEAAWISVVEFIKFYNKNNNK